MPTEPTWDETTETLDQPSWENTLSGEDVLGAGSKATGRALGEVTRNIELGALATPDQPAPTVPPQLRFQKYGPLQRPQEPVLSQRLAQLAENVPPGHNAFTQPLSSLSKSILRIGAGMTAPENVTTMGAFASPPGAIAAGGYFGYEALKNAWQDYRRIRQLMDQPGPIDEKFKQELSDALVDAETSLAVAGEIGAGGARAGLRAIPRPVGPEFGQPRVPRLQPLELTGAALPGVPRGATPLRATAGPDVLGPPVPPLSLRTMPESAVTQPEAGREISQVQEIREKGLRTKAEVLDNFPVLRTLSSPNERAAALLRQAYPPPVQGPPLPPPAEPQGPPLPQPGPITMQPEATSAEIRRRNLRTVDEVLDAMPKLRGQNERQRAQQLLDRAWGGQVPPPRPPGVRVGPLQGPDRVVAGTRPVVRPMGVENVPDIQGPQIPPEVQAQREREANMQREIEARRSALQQMIIFWERELEMARNRGDSRGEQKAVQMLLQFRREYEAIPPVKEIAPKPPLARAPGRPFRPIVPETPTETGETVAQVVKRKNIKTIQALLNEFPKMRGTGGANEWARSILKQIWGAFPPGVVQGPPLPSSEQQQPPEEPPAAPPGPTVPKPPGPPPAEPGGAPAPTTPPSEELPPTEQPAPEAPPPPTAPRIEDTVIAGKMLGEWETVRDASQLPKGNARAELARWLAVPNQPARILQALGNKRRTREIHAPPAGEVAPVEPEAPPQSQAPPATVAEPEEPEKPVSQSVKAAQEKGEELTPEQIANLERLDRAVERVQEKQNTRNRISLLKEQLDKEQGKLDKNLAKMGTMVPPPIVSEITRKIASRMARIQDQIDDLEKTLAEPAPKTPAAAPETTPTPPAAPGGGAHPLDALLPEGVKGKGTVTPAGVYVTPGLTKAQYDKFFLDADKAGYEGAGYTQKGKGPIHGEFEPKKTGAELEIRKLQARVGRLEAVAEMSPDQAEAAQAEIAKLRKEIEDLQGPAKAVEEPQGMKPEVRAEVDRILGTIEDNQTSVRALDELRSLKNRDQLTIDQFADLEKKVAKLRIEGIRKFNPEAAYFEEQKPAMDAIMAQVGKGPGRQISESGAMKDAYRYVTDALNAAQRRKVRDLAEAAGWRFTGESDVDPSYGRGLKTLSFKPPVAKKTSAAAVTPPEPSAGGSPVAAAAPYPESMKASGYSAPQHNEPDLVLIGCGKEKAATDTPIPAADLYTGPLFAARKGFADSQSRPWMILSALHGVVEPGRKINPYDVTIQDLKPEELAQWKAAVRAKLLDYFGGRQGTIGKSIELHAGRDYATKLEEALQGLGVTVETAMQGKGIGVQISQYKQGYQRPQTLGGFGSQKGMPQPPTTPPEPTASTETATAKAQKEVTKVAQTEGQRPAKEVKQELLAELQKAIDEAPTEEELIRKTGAKVALNKEKFEAQKRDIRRGKQVGRVTIDIPGDGVFTVINTKEALQEVMDRAKAISTAPGGPVKVTRRTVTKEQSAEYAKEAEELAKGKPSKGPGAAAAAEFEEGEMPLPNPAVYGLSAGSPWWNTRVREIQNMVEGFAQLGQGRGYNKKRIAQSLNAADNIPRVLGQQAGNSFRLRLRNVLEQRAVTALMQAMKMSGEGLEPDDLARLTEEKQLKYAGDPTGYLRGEQTDLETYAQEQINKGRRLEAQAAIDLAQAMQYARDHYAELKPVAAEAKKRLDQQLLSEEARGLETDYERWYVPQRHDLDLLPAANRPIVIGQSKGSGPSSQFRKAKYYEDYSSAIQAGFIPRTLSIADLMEHRVMQGERLAARKAMFEGLRRVRDPIDRKPVAITIPKRKIKRPDGTVDTRESVPLDYEPFEVLPGVRLAVHKGYARMLRALTGSSQISESAPIAAAQNLAAFEKHIGLALDTFHLVRTLITELAATGRVSVGERMQRGTSLLEYDVADLDRAVQAGLISQDTANWVRNPQQWEVHGKTIQASPRAIVNLGLKNGLGLGRIADAIYKDWIRELPVFGTVNKTVFDKITRSAMAHGFLTEFGRVAKQHPEWTGEQVARTVGSDINVLFGNLQKESWIRSPSLNALMQIGFLAPNWVQSLIRREARGAMQLAEAGGRLVRGKEAKLETAGKVMGTGVLASIIGTQLLNLITRHQLTFQNQEEGHKLDAWVPDPFGGGKGFFISPLAIFGEITHELIRYSFTKPDFASELSQIGANKLGNIGRAIAVLATGRDPFTDQKIIGTPQRLAAAGVQMVPVPIILSGGARMAVGAVAPGMVRQATTTDLERQIASSFGVKTEPAPSAQSEVRRLVDHWKMTQEPKLQADVQRRLKEDFRGPYTDLRQALARGDDGQAQRAYQQLRQDGSTPKQIRQTMHHPHPFAGSRALERRFYDSLTPQQQKLYDEAINEREQIGQRFDEMLETKPQLTE